MKTQQVKEKASLNSLATLFQHFFSNLHTAAEWLWQYWTPPVVILGILGAIIFLCKRQRSGIFIFWSY
jgi:hypothetical protein